MKNLSRGLLMSILGFFLLSATGCITLEIRRIPVAVPHAEKSTRKETTNSNSSITRYYNIYLCNKNFKNLDLETVLALEEESPVYCITTRAYEIDLKNQTLNIKGGSMAIACTSASQTKDGNHKYVKMQLADAQTAQIALDHQWITCIVEETIKTKDNKEECYVTVYGRKISLYKLLLPRTKVE